MLICASENEEFTADTLTKEDEIFFGPVRHIEKCVAIAVNEVAEASDRLRPLSPLTAQQMAELCREACTVAYQIEHADNLKHSFSHSDQAKLKSFVADSSKPTSFANSSEPPAACDDSSKLLPLCDDGDRAESLASFANSSKPPVSCADCSKLCLHDDGDSAKPPLSLAPSFNLPLLSDENLVSFCDESDSAKPPSSLTDSSKLLSLCNVNDSTMSPPSLAHSVNLSFSCDDGSGPLSSHGETTFTSSNDELSNIKLIQDLSFNVDETIGGPCLDEALSTSRCDNQTQGDTGSGRESCDNKTPSNNCFEGLLLSLGSALPVMEPGFLKQDERGVVEFTAASARDTSSTADVGAKRRTAVRAPADLRRAFTAKTSAIRSAGGIPVKALTVKR